MWVMNWVKKNKPSQFGNGLPFKQVKVSLASNSAHINSIVSINILGDVNMSLSMGFFCFQGNEITVILFC